MILIKQNAGLKLPDSIKNGYAAFLLLLFIGLACHLHPLYGVSQPEPRILTYYLFIEDFANSFIEIPTSNVSGSSTTTASSFLAGGASLYDVNDTKVGTCSASFLSMQTADRIFTDISNYISIDDNGLIVTWFSPVNLINLELDSLIHSMVTECIVVASTKVGFAPFYGQTFNLIVSSDDEKIYFEFSMIRTIF